MAQDNSGVYRPAGGSSVAPNLLQVKFVSQLPLMVDKSLSSDYRFPIAEQRLFSTTWATQALIVALNAGAPSGTASR